MYIKSENSKLGNMGRDRWGAAGWGGGGESLITYPPSFQSTQVAFNRNQFYTQNYNKRPEI